MFVLIGDLIRRFRDERKAGRLISILAGAVLLVAWFDEVVLTQYDMSTEIENLAAIAVAGVLDYAWKKIRKSFNIEP